MFRLKLTCNIYFIMQMHIKSLKDHLYYYHDEHVYRQVLKELTEFKGEDELQLKTVTRSKGFII